MTRQAQVLRKIVGSELAQSPEKNMKRKAVALDEADS